MRKILATLLLTVPLMLSVSACETWDDEGIEEEGV